MKISTKGRYALRMLLDLSEHREGFVSLKDLAARQEISKKYLEQIVPLLSRAGMLEANRGFQGGYRLARRPEEYTVLEILELTEGGLFLVPCTKQEECCARSADCAALPLWKGLDSVMRSYLKGVTLADLVQQHLACGGDDYVI